MNYLSKSELIELNDLMLGRGAPIERDNIGYSSYDYSKVFHLSSETQLTNYEAYKLASVLMRYTKTQLVSYRDKIKSTVDFYQNLFKSVKVRQFNNKQVELTWSYSAKVGNFIKENLDRTQYRWSKPDDWVFTINWSSIDPLISVFKEEEYSVTEIEEARATLNASPQSDDSVTENSTQSESEETFIINVSRPEDTIDTIVLQTEYDRRVVSVFKQTPYMFFNSSQKTWECYIEYANLLYNNLSNLDMKLDMTQLKPWADLVKNWDSTHTLVDLSNYNLRFTPYDFQPEDAKKLLSMKAGLNGNDMGCGKTFEQVIIGESIPYKKLVICPPTLRLNWKHEIKMVNPDVPVHILYSHDDYSIVDGWNIIGYNSLDKFITDLENEQFQCIMIDEAHYIQAIANSGLPTSNRARNVLRLCATSQYVFPITGTPKTNRNKNIFNILRSIRHPLTRGKWAFRNFGVEYCDGQHLSFGWDFNGNSNDVDLCSQLEPYMVRHLKKDVLPHLKKQRTITPVEVDLREYHYEISEYLRNRSNKNAEDLARLMRARKVLATQKVGESIDFAKSLLQQDKQVVIVTCFTEVVTAVEKAFKNNVTKLVGGMSDTAKDKAIQDFQSGRVQVMVMNIIAGGVGVTLTKAHNMIINDFDWTPGNLVQAEDRICRGGQVEEYCNIFYLYAEGADMDEVFAQTLTSKFSTINNVVDGGMGDEINYLDLINKALEKSTGIKKVRKINKVKNEETSNTYKGKSIEELQKIAKEVGATCKLYEDERIYRMRLIMAIKKQVGE